jgi:hypothetical protein
MIFQGLESPLGKDVLEAIQKVVGLSINCNTNVHPVLTTL